MPDSVELLIDAKVTLGEGPFWDADAGVLYWLDILSGQVFIYDPATGRNKSVDVGEHVGTIVPRKDGGAIVAHGRASPALEIPFLVPAEVAPRDGPALPAREALGLGAGWRQAQYGLSR